MSDLTITDGLAPWQVLQRDPTGVAVVRLGGVAPAGAGVIEGRMADLDGGVALDWRRVGEAAGGAWEGEMRGLPAGGPYRLEVRRAGRPEAEATVAPILVGDLWVLAGQSNMEGVGNLVGVEAPSPHVHSFDLTDRWCRAEEPLHWLNESVDPVHWTCDPADRPAVVAETRRSRAKGAGLGLPFAKRLVEATGVPVGLIPCAHGGTSMEQWDPKRRGEGGRSLYGSLMRRVEAAGGRVTGVLWYQGESDAHPEAAALFPARFRELIQAIRRDANSPRLPFLFVQLGRFVLEDAGKSPEGWNAVREAQRRAASETEDIDVVSAIDLELDDLIHVGTQGLKRLGRRLSVLARRHVFDEASLQVGPMPCEAWVEGPNRDLIRLVYAGVNGALTSKGRLSGFSIHHPDGSEASLIYKAEVACDVEHTVYLRLSGPVPDGATLSYGWGLDPYCNLEDALELAAPAFGPWSLK